MVSKVSDKDRKSWVAIEGSAYPLGATWIAREKAYNFALYSKHATSVALLLFAPDDASTPVLRVDLDYRVNKSGRIWHCRPSPQHLRGARRETALRLVGRALHVQDDRVALDLLLDDFHDVLGHVLHPPRVQSCTRPEVYTTPPL